MDLLDFIDRQRNVKKAKNYAALPVEITNYIFKCVLEKKLPDQVKKRRNPIKTYVQNDMNQQP